MTVSERGEAVELVLRDYARQRRRRLAALAALALAVLAALLLDIGTGPAAIAPGDALAHLLHLRPLPGAQGVILLELRLPVALMAVLAGAALALAGAEMQTILANPLADPFTLGVSSAAALGAALAIVLGVGVGGLAGAWMVAANAFLFALGSLALVQLLARAAGGTAETVVLFGIAIGFAANALLSLLQFVASPDALQQLVFWSLGSLARADWTVVPVLGLVLAFAVPFSLGSARDLTALRLGEERARAFGIDTRRLRAFALLRVSLLAAATVAFIGIVGFVGLVAPHIARMLVGEDHRLFLPASMLTGALTVSAASVATKLVVPGLMIPIGIVTALVGLPAFVWLVMRRQRRRA